MQKYIVKNSHCLNPDMIFAALSLVYLNPWVTLLSLLSWSIAESKTVTNLYRLREMVNCRSLHFYSPVRIEIEKTIRNFY